MSTTKTPARKSKADTTQDGKTPVLCWMEVGLTVPIGDDPYTYVKTTFGYQRMSPSDREVDINRTERAMYEHCEAIVEKRMRKLIRLSKAVKRGEG